MPKDLAGLLPILSLTVVLLGLAWTYFGAVINIKERLTKLETKMELFWEPLQAFLTKAIHHPDTPTVDAKLEHFEELKLDELYELKVELKRDFDALVLSGGKTSNKAFFYTMLTARVDLIIHDRMQELCKSQGIWSKISRTLLGRV